MIVQNSSTTKTLIVTGYAVAYILNKEPGCKEVEMTSLTPPCNAIKMRYIEICIQLSVHTSRTLFSQPYVLPVSPNQAKDPRKM